MPICFHGPDRSIHGETTITRRHPMGTISAGARTAKTVHASEPDDDKRCAQARALREKNRFWNEKPATRFCVYFGVFVASEVLVLITLHWIFHII